MADYVNHYRDGEACFQVQSVLAKINLCRTSALGGRWYECDDCGEQTKLYNSCGDRHCPACTGSKRADWSDQVSKLLLPAVDYYQVIFTLPEILSTLALANRRVMADLLSQSAWKALDKSVRIEQGYEPAALMVLHTWNQKLEPHWHVHALVPGGGPSLRDGSWKTAASPPVGEELGKRMPEKYLVDAINLRRRFRKFAIRKLKKLRDAGELRYGGSLAYLADEPAWETLLEELETVEWVSHIEAPRGQASDPMHVVRYLTRYLTGGPIGNSRLLSADDDTVTFMARTGEKVGGERVQEPYTLPRLEFVRRWCTHIQPQQLTKTRFYGGWSTSKSTRYLERCEAGLRAAKLWREPATTEPKPSKDSEPLACSHCGSDRLRLVYEEAKPSWRDVLSNESRVCPSWYVATLEQSHRDFLDSLLGAGRWEYADDDLGPWIESAKRASSARGGWSYQRWFPGLEPAFNFAAASF